MIWLFEQTVGTCIAHDYPHGPSPVAACGALQSRPLVLRVVWTAHDHAGRVPLCRECRKLAIHPPETAARELAADTPLALADRAGGHARKAAQVLHEGRRGFPRGRGV